MANKFYITAGLPTKRDGTYVTGTNKAFITAGLVPESTAAWSDWASTWSFTTEAGGWAHTINGVTMASVNGITKANISEINGV